LAKTFLENLMRDYQANLAQTDFTNKNEILTKNSYFKMAVTIATSSILFQGCITSSRQDQLQSSITQLQGQVFQMQEQLNKREQQITNTTQTVLSSQNDVESLQTQLQLTQGSVDELKAKMKRIEENSGGSPSEQNVISLNNQTDSLTQIQRQLARIELAANSKVGASRKGKLPAKIHTLAEVNKSLKSSFEQGNFKQTIETSNSVINASDANDAMLQSAIEYRAESKFKTQDYKGSAIDFSNYIESYPNTQKYPRALLLAGDSYVYLKNNSIAKSYYQECAKIFPNLPEGKAAAGRLANLSAQSSTSQAQAQ
jgi:TolA-binding protein